MSALSPRGASGASQVLPPFDEASARTKVRLAEDAWNSRDPERVVLAYSEDSEWRNRSERFAGREAVSDFLHRKWRSELDYRLIKEAWTHGPTRIAVRFVYECRDAHGAWKRAYGNELWEFDAGGLMCRRQASINDVPLLERERLFHWPLGPRPTDHPGLTELGL